MADLYTRFDSTFFEKTRLSILTIVYRREVVSFNVLKSMLHMTDGAVYAHVEKLVQAGYLAKQREIAEGVVQTNYTMTESGKDSFRQYLEFLESMLASHREKGDTK